MIQTIEEPQVILTKKKGPHLDLAIAPGKVRFGSICFRSDSYLFGSDWVRVAKFGSGSDYPF